MKLDKYFQSDAHLQEGQDMPVLRELIGRYQEEKPFSGLNIVFGHVIVRNTMIEVEALAAGGANLAITEVFSSPHAAPVKNDLLRFGIPVYAAAEGVQQADVFLDVNAVLGRKRTPKAAVEITRTGVLHYEKIGCPVMSADNSLSKNLEGFFGTGDGFVRAWQLLRPDDSLAGRKIVQFGYGKIGRGLAFRCRQAGAHSVIADVSAESRGRASEDGFAAVDGKPDEALQSELESADIIIAVTGIPGIVGKSIPAAWLRASGAVLVNLGAEDEFGPDFEGEVLGGRQIPLNFHLANPTQNRFVDPPLAAHVLALEAYVKNPSAYGPGIHPLPEDMDRWVLDTWRKHWPDQDLTGIGDKLGLK